MTGSIRKQLQAAIAERRMVKIIRSLPDAEGMEGIPLALGRKLLLLYTVNPDLLLPDGFSVVRVEDVTEVRSGDWEQVVGRMLADESRLPDAAAAPEVRLGSWAQLLADLHARGERVMVDGHPEENSFFLGAILTLRRDEFELRHIDTAARWEDDTWWIEHRELTRVRWNNPYVGVFTRYAGDRPEF